MEIRGENNVKTASNREINTSSNRIIEEKNRNAKNTKKS